MEYFFSCRGNASRLAEVDLDLKRPLLKVIKLLLQIASINIHLRHCSNYQSFSYFSEESSGSWCVKLTLGPFSDLRLELPPFPFVLSASQSFLTLFSSFTFFVFSLAQTVGRPGALIPAIDSSKTKMAFSLARVFLFFFPIARPGKKEAIVGQEVGLKPKLAAVPFKLIHGVLL